ncbi:hypothetical protein BN1423_710002 [Carnobacterium maltaromaticum]|nr:hypothetical protein CM318V1_460034 [Carnobacterium maltaromaticum]CRH23096.1 hypothetical protein BN1423_710002 [Carnobacterium maltaromaticum]
MFFLSLHLLPIFTISTNTLNKDRYKLTSFNKILIFRLIIQSIKDFFVSDISNKKQAIKKLEYFNFLIA